MGANLPFRRTLTLINRQDDGGRCEGIILVARKNDPIIYFYTDNCLDESALKIGSIVEWWTLFVYSFIVSMNFSIVLFK